ncbi:hypothetical protein [uncultured Desulfosarcina sp.]|uniref:hypothetical protein n=1 Tax=uncultured Desulfosarcina sp. TaxID=218289 RepID=UPI0029C8EF31|nr:hypothetical protein [uncultured Desulfosarcina sp.]
MKLWNTIVFALCTVLLTGCASSETKIESFVKAGDTVTVDYTCRFNNDELAATTLADAVQDPKETKSPVFRSPEKFGPYICKIADDGLEEKRFMGQSKIIGIEEAIRRELNKKLAGLPAEETVTIKLETDANETLPRDVRYYTETRVRTCKKEQRQSLKQYVAFHGQPPAIGEQYDFDHIFTATVTTVDAATDTIITRIEPKPGAVYPSDFGSVTIVDGGDAYRIVFDVAEGRLVRIGNRIGRIDHVDKYVFTVDWGHPFGHEVLSCEVTVNPIKK